MQLQLVLPQTAALPSIVNLTGKTIFTRIIHRTIRFPSYICQSAGMAELRLRLLPVRKPLESMRSIWRRMQENSCMMNGKTVLL